MLTQTLTPTQTLTLILTLIPTLALTQTLTQTEEKHYFASRGKIATSYEKITLIRIWFAKNIGLESVFGYNIAQINI